MSASGVQAAASALAALGWRDAGAFEPEEALMRMRASVGRINGLSEEEAVSAVTHLADPKRTHQKRREAMFFGTRAWLGACHTYVRIIGKEPAFSFFLCSRGCGEHDDLFLCCDDVPICHVRVFRDEDALREGFTSFSAREQERLSDAFGFIQFRVFTSGDTTLYFGSDEDKRQDAAFVWTDEGNAVLSAFPEFAAALLGPNALYDYVRRSVLVKTVSGEETLIILRPYQHHACRLMIEKVRAHERDGGPAPRGYIWHSTGSGKTITMIATAIGLLEQTRCEKVVIVVDRLDLDEQTVGVLSSFLGTVSVIRSEKDLTRRLNARAPRNGLRDRILVTTIGKMGTAARRGARKDRFVFLFDECHRSQDGKNNSSISAACPESPVFGVTGTPIHLIDATAGRRTTDNIFGECLHKYLIHHACRDKNVLPFNIIYKAAMSRGEMTAMFFEDPLNIRRIARQIVSDNDALTHNRRYASIVTFSTVAALRAFYEAAQSEIRRQGSGIRLALSVSPSCQRAPGQQIPEDDEEAAVMEAGGAGEEPGFEEDGAALMDRVVNEYAIERGLSDEAVEGLKSAGFRGYRKDLAARIQREGEGAVDMLLVVGQFITGFDAPRVNTVYVMRKIKMHTLIQTISRANRPFGADKAFGNAVFFQEAKPDVEKALRAYNDGDIGVLNRFVLRPTYAELISGLNSSLEVILNLESDPRDDDGASLREALAVSSAGLRMFPTYVEHNELDLRLQRRDALDLIARMRGRLRERDEEAGTETLPVIDGVIETERAVFDHVRLGNGASIVRMADYEQRLAKIDFDPGDDDDAARLIAKSTVIGLKPGTDGDDSEETLLTVREMEAMFEARLTSARAKMTAHYAAAWGIEPDPACRLIARAFEERVLRLIPKMIKEAGFDAGLGVFRLREPLTCLLRLVNSRFPLM